MVSIRRMTVDDVAAAQALLAQLGYPLDAEEVQRRTDAVIRTEGHVLMVAEQSGGVVALCHVFARPALDKPPEAVVQALSHPYQNLLTPEQRGPIPRVFFLSGAYQSVLASLVAWMRCHGRCGRAPASSNTSMIRRCCSIACGVPLWLAPVQAVVLTITDRQIPYAERVLAALKAAGVRAIADLRNEKITYKIREHSLQKLPYQVILGDKEMAAQTVAVRTRKGEDLGQMPIKVFIERLLDEALQFGRAA